MLLPSPEIKCREQFGIYLNKLGLIGQAIEIGTWKGDFALQFRATWQGHILHCIDPYENYAEYDEDPKRVTNEGKGWMQLEESEGIFHQRMAYLGDNYPYHHLRMRSDNACHLFNNETIDFVYHDANHRYEFVKDDIMNYWPLLVRGGIMAGHDIESNSVWTGVRQAVNEFLEHENLDGYTVQGDAHSWYVFKPY